MLSNISYKELSHKAISLISSAFVTRKYFLFAGIRIHPALDGLGWFGKALRSGEAELKNIADLENENPLKA